jgi:methionyl aminopeptidase
VIAKTEQDIQGLRKAGKLLADVLRATAARTVPGVSALELDEFAEAQIRAQGGEPLFLNYDEDDGPYPYPATLCVSINEEVVHAIPTAGKIIQDGDIVSLDLGVLINGYSADAAVTVIVGEGNSDAERLVSSTRLALLAGIKAAKAGARTGDIGAAVAEVAKDYSVSVVYDLGGHGTGRAEFHEAPFIPNMGTSGKGEVLEEGMVIAIEPIFTLGSGAIKTSGDGWTYATRDGSRAAHFEHTVIVGKQGCEILTL